MPRLSPPQAPKPLLTRLLTPDGPPPTRLFEDGDAAVMAVPGRYSVSYLLLGEDTVAVADCGSAADVERVLSALDWLGRPHDQLRWVIPTHLHFDHMMGVDALARRVGAEVALSPVGAAHVRDGRRLRWPRRRFLVRALPTWPMQGLPFFPREDWEGGLDFGFPWAQNRFRASVGRVLDDGTALDGLPGWRVVLTPGHADEALCLYHEGAGWLVAGDTLRNFLGGEWNPLLADAGDYAESRRRLASLEVRRVFPGHGPTFAVDGGLRALRPLPWYAP